MKQTNNAIKFLMAQYRAIFKNANIAMVAAMVAAALAAGQAQAKPGDQGEPFEAFEQQLADGVIAKGEDLVHDGKSGEFIILKAPNKNPIVINGGKLEMTNAVKGHIYTTNDIVVKSGTLSVTANNESTKLIPGLVGSAADTVNGAQPTVASLTVDGGKVDLKKSFIQMKNVTLNGGEITAEGANNKQSSSKYGSYSTIMAWGGVMKVGGNAVVNLNPASLLYGSNVSITGGTINFNGTSETGLTGEKGAYLRTGDDINDGTLNVAGGKLVIAEGKFGSATGTNINITGGAVDVKGTFTLGKDFKGTNDSTISVTGGKVSVAKDGTLGLDGTITFADGTLANAGTVDFKIAEGRTSSITVGKNDFANLLKGEGAKVNVSGASSTSDKKETFNLVVDGDVDLVAAGVVKATDGTATDKFVINDSVEKSSFTAKKVTIGAGTYSATKTLTADTLTAGKDGAFAIGKDLTVTVKNGLTVTAKESKADLSVGGTLNLDGTGGNVAANVELKDDNTSSPVLNVDSGKWTMQSLKLTKGTASVTGEGTTLNIAKKLETKATDGTMTIDDNAKVDASAADLNLAKATIDIKNGSTLVLDGKDVFKKKSDGTFETVTSGTDVKSTFAAGSVKTDSTSILQLNSTGDLVVDDLDKIKKAINADDGLKGFIKIAGVNITDKPTQDTGIDKVKDGFDGLYNDVAVTVADGNVSKSFTADQVKLTGAETTASVANEKTVMLTGKKGDFITTKAGEAADAKVGKGASLVLAGNGNIGAISAGSTNQGDKGTVAIGHSSLGYGTVNAKSIDGGTAGLDVAVYGSTLNVAGKVAATDLTIEQGSTLNIKAEAGQGAVTAATLNLGVGSSINAAGQDITVSGADSADIFGDVEAGTLSLSGGATITGDADVKLGTLKLQDGKTLNVGRDGEDGSTATVFTDKLVMGAGSTIFVDPSYNDPATVLATKVLTDDTAGADVSVTNGDIKVGKNAAFGIGFDQAEFESVMANYLVDGKFTDPVNNQGYANAFVLNTSLNIKSGTGVAVKHDLQDSDTVTDNSFTLGGRAALIITDKAFGADKQGTAITFGDSTTGVQTATVTADGSSVISLVGDFDAKDTNLKIFAAVNGGAGAGTVNITNDVKVQALGGLLEGTLSNTSAGTLDKLKLSPDAEKMAYVGVARPVGDFFLGLAKGDYAVDRTQAGHKFVTTVMNTDGGFQVVDTAAHAATYAGAQQAAVAAVTTMADAMFGRVGAVGVEAASISATGSQANGGVWLTPMYKSMDSDGFNAEGASYGSDVDVAGVAFGADTVNGNMRFGAVFNIGSGDSEGKGQGNGLKDEFDYYGFGIYSAMGFGNFALVGDASLTVVSHEVEGLGLKGKADTTAVTMGITGQYTVATEAVDVTPHLGARFIRLNTDSYDLMSADGAIATTDFDVQNVFSVPLGVTLSKGFVTGGWTLAPSADLTVTFNAGDTEAKSTTTFSGIAHGINLNTEVLDEVQYGVTLGLGAQYGAFGTSFGINYTGSSNTDSFGVNAQARYMF